MKPYSQDLRDKVLAAVAAGKPSNRKVAAAFGISESAIEKWTRRQRESGSSAALPHAGGPTRVLAEHAELIRAAVQAQPDISLAELCAHVKTQTGTLAQANMMWRALQRLNLPRKKVAPRQSARNRAGEGPANGVS